MTNAGWLDKDAFTGCRKKFFIMKLLIILIVITWTALTNNVIVKVGNGSISLIGAASLPVNIVGTLLGGNTNEIGKNIEN